MKRVQPANSVEMGKSSEVASMPHDEPVARPIEFHLFPRLPPEIQLIIWAIWREDQPVMRQYCFMEREGRCYAALDMEKLQFVKTAGGSIDLRTGESAPLDPMEHQICFTNNISTVTVPEDILRMFRNPRIEQNRRILSPAYTWVNFQRHTFFVHNAHYRLPGRLRFLFHNIGAKIPQEIKSDHWSKRIQKLAVFATAESNTLNDLDKAALLQLTGMKTVFIILPMHHYNNWRQLKDGVCRCQGPCSRNLTGQRYCGIRQEIRGNGFLDVDIEERIAEVTARYGDWESSFPPMEQPCAQRLLVKIKEIFSLNGRDKVQVKVVVDVWSLVKSWVK
ncbi:Uu.00g139980.m01.CDS01 [Anthostomella pinea]|uniref:Uu.00g139980.m01.CDS01 n=1 Tax=Anthostomella pinea TaxID=933095 RepID=A0AAI8YLB1_9PEZI|nr:Uu.00g139980.m01.CDS01 [Anthostomella pinea]